MRLAILLLPISIVTTSPLPVQKLPRQPDFKCPQLFANFDIDQDTVSTDLFNTLPSSSSFSPSAELDPNGSLFDSEILPDDLTYSLIPKLPSQPYSSCPQLFANFDIGQDTVSTDLFNTLPSSSSFSPSTELDPNGSLFDAEIPPDDVKYSLIPFREVYGNIGQGPPLARILRQEQKERTRFYTVPIRKCDPGTRPFCTTPVFVTQEGPNRFSLKHAYDLTDDIATQIEPVESPCPNSNTIYCCSKYSLEELSPIRSLNDGSVSVSF